MSSEEYNVIEPEPAPVPLSTIFCADDADLVIRVVGSRDFRVYKHILALASPVFRDMLNSPQPPTNTSSTPPHIDVDGSAETWERILQTIYPMPNPIINDLDDLESFLLVAMKYDMQFVTDSYVKIFESRDFIQQDPLHLYAIACACGLEEQAKYVAGNAKLLTVAASPDAGDLRGLTVDSYQNLVSFLAKRDNEWDQLIKRAEASPGYCGCYRGSTTTLYDGIKEDLKTPYLQIEEVYLRALEARPRLHHTEWCSDTNCPRTNSGIRSFIDRVANGRERSRNSFTPGTSALGLITPHSKVPRRKLGLMANCRMSLFSRTVLLLSFSCVVLLLSLCRALPCTPF